MMLGRQSGLGRGLGALIPPKHSDHGASPPTPSPAEAVATDRQPQASDGTEISFLPVGSIDPNPHQPRSHFDHGQLEDLIASIQEHGVLQPIVVTPAEDGRFELISGERRLRASKIAGRETIPAIVRTATEQQKLELALIENIQRQDLNPLEEAEAYQRLQSEFNLTQEDLSKRVGKSRPQVANTIRLLQLPEEIKDAIRQGKITASNARTLLSLPTEDERRTLFRAMLEGNFTVRQTEARIPHRHTRRVAVIDANVVDTERKLREALGSKVIIKRDQRGEGEIRITFLSDEDLESLIKKILGE